MKIQLLTSGLLLGQYASAFSPALTTRSNGLNIRSKQPTSIIATYSAVEGDQAQKESVVDDIPAAKFLDDSGEHDFLGEPIPYSKLTIGVLKETFPGENRVSQTPDSIKTLVKEGFTVVVEEGGSLLFIVAPFGLESN